MAHSTYLARRGARARVFIFVHICIYLCVCLHIRTCLCICLCLCLCICAYLCVFMYAFMFVCVCVCDAGRLSSTEDQRLNTFTSLSLLCPLCLSWFVLYSFSAPFMSFLPDESRLDCQPVAMRP